MKKVLWMVNSELPQIAKVRGRKGSNTCGWITGAYGYINEKFDLTVVYPVFKAEDAETRLDGDVKYVAYLHTENSKSEIETFSQIIRRVAPDVVDIWGTEFSRSYNFAAACKMTGYIDKTIVSMQGSSTEIAAHYASNLRGRILCKKTLRDLLRRDSIKNQIKSYEKRAENERKTLKLVSNCIGKTHWDEAVCKRANPDIRYSRCHEILRDGFYENKGSWSLENCRPHSMLLCQGNYPLKGLHIILDALRELKKKYPDVTLTVTGTPPYFTGSLKSSLKNSAYGKYIKKLIERYGLADNVSFVGMKTESEMISVYLDSNVVVLASSVENESNSVAEAHILGVPVVASFSGGVTSRMTHGADGFMFSYDDPHMLAFWVDKLFSDAELSTRFSKNGVASAEAFNDAETNNKTREQIYLSVIDKQ